MTYLCAALRVYPKIAHPPVALEAGLVISDLQSGHAGVIRVSNSVAIFARRETIDYRIFKDSGGYRMAVLTWQGTALAVLVVAGPAITRDGGMFFMVEHYDFIFI
jgi:hypothetical protein